MLNRAIEDASDFRGLLDKIQSPGQHKRMIIAHSAYGLGAAVESLDALAKSTRGARKATGAYSDVLLGMTPLNVYPRHPGENRAQHRARLRAMEVL